VAERVDRQCAGHRNFNKRRIKVIGNTSFKISERHANPNYCMYLEFICKKIDFDLTKPAVSFDGQFHRTEAAQSRFARDLTGTEISRP